LDLDSTERDAWVADAQRWIGTIVGVKQCKIDLDAQGGVTDVRVIASQERDPRHIVRDVESLLKTRCDLDIYYKKIGVVQVMDDGESGSADPEGAAAVVRDTSGVTFHPPGPVPEADEEDDLLLGADSAPASGEAPRSDARSAAPGPVPAEPRVPTPAILVAEGLTPRIILGRVGVMASEKLLRAEVNLRAGGVEASAFREGANHAGSEVTLIARATLAAVVQLVGEPVLLHLNEIRIRNLGGEQVVMAAVDLTEGRRTETLFGTCSTRHNRNQAVAYALLDALNRRLSLMAVKTPQDDS
jgi:hypothetical protein